MLPHGAGLRQRGRDRVAGGVVAPVALGYGPLHHRADALAHPAHGLVLRVPVRDEDRHHVRGGDLVDPLAAEPLHGVVPERGPPLLLALAGVLPAFAMDRDHGLDGLGECGHVLAPLEGEGIAAGPCDLPVLEGRLTGFGQGDVGEASEPCVAAGPVDGAAPDPVFRDRLSLARFVDSQSEAVFVAVDPRAVDGSDEGGGEFSLLVGGLRGSRTRVFHPNSSLIESHNSTENRC